MVVSGFFYRRILQESSPLMGKSCLLFTGIGKAHKGMAVLYPRANRIFDYTLIKDSGKRKQAATFADGFVLPWQQLMAEARKQGKTDQIKSSLFNLVSDNEVMESDLIDSAGMPYVRIAVEGDLTGFREVKRLSTVAAKILTESSEKQTAELNALSEADLEEQVEEALASIF